MELQFRRRGGHDVAERRKQTGIANHGTAKMVEFLMKWAFAFALLTLTYNPTSYSYVDWAFSGRPDPLSLFVLSGLVLFVGYIIYLRATLRSIGVFGMGLVLALVGALLWVLYDLGALTLDDARRNTWLGLIVLSFVLGIGLSWSHVRRKLAGQHDVDDVDE